MKTTAYERLLARRACDVQGRGATPVELVVGCAGPKLLGCQSRYETLAGDVIQCPQAYRKLGWSNMRYRHATYRVEVSVGWLRRAVGNYR